MQYQLAFCFWLLTFDVYIAKTINAYVVAPIPARAALTANPPQ